MIKETLKKGDLLQHNSVKYIIIVLENECDRKIWNEIRAYGRHVRNKVPHIRHSHLETLKESFEKLSK